MVEVPENQRIEKILATRFNHDFAKIAHQLQPHLISSPRWPQRVITFEKNSNSFFGLRAKPTHTIEQLSERHMSRGDSLILDFGIHMVGRLSFKVTAHGLNIDAPCRLKVIFGESPIDVEEGMDNVQTWISTSWLPDEIINIDYFPEVVALPRRYACRYIRFDVIDTSPKYSVTLSEVKFEVVSSIGPDQRIEKYDFGDDMLNRIDHVSISTLRDCMQTVFEDGPRRDRRLWIGDLRLQALTAYCIFKDYALAKRCIFMFAALIREDGSLPACLFEHPTLSPATDYIVDYDALFAVIVLEYVEASGDKTTGKLMWETVRSCLKRAIDHLNPTTKIFEIERGTGWKFLDWKEELHRAAGLHGLLLFCLQAANKLASLLSLDAEFSDLVEAMKCAAGEFYDSELETVVSGPEKQVSLASAAWLVLGKAFSPSMSRSILKNTMSHPDRVEPSTPYLWHYVCEAMASVELYDECIDLLRSYWGGMVDAGADTFWECFDANKPRLSPYGDVRNNSFCHAWSCTPSFLLRRQLAAHLHAQEISASMRELDAFWIDQQVPTSSSLPNQAERLET